MKQWQVDKLKNERDYSKLVERVRLRKIQYYIRHILPNQEVKHEYVKGNMGSNKQTTNL